MDRFYEYIISNNIPKYRYEQIAQAIYKDLVDDFDEITTLSKEMREKLSSDFDFNTLENKATVISKKKDTIKTLFNVKRLDRLIETVLMRHKDGRNTICVSCMHGCPVGCKFCATGKLGFGGNLTSDEIVEQIIFFQKYINSNYPEERITNIVYMGMGEPMLNLSEVKKSLEIISEKMGMSKRRVTVSTSGYVSQLYDLLNSGYRGRVAISLHAPNQTLREELMPVVSKLYNLDQLMEALEKFEELTNKRITYEYIMIDNKNDTPEHAEQLSKLLNNRLAHVNLIPYNPIRGENYKKSTEKSILEFQKILKENNIPNTVRITMGSDVNAACGQLAASQN